MAYRDDLAALAARRAALEHEVVNSSRGLVREGERLEEAAARSRPSVLANIRIASPCTARWSAMAGDERKRECGDCNKTVFNLSALTRAEAEALVIEHAGDLCARYYQRADGTILLADCTIAAGARRRQLVLTGAATAVLAGTIASVGATPSEAIPLGETIEGRETVRPRAAMARAEDPPPPTPPLELPPPELPPFEFPPTEEVIHVEGFAPIVEITTVTMGGIGFYEEYVEGTPLLWRTDRAK